jgi:hypothetical protein
MLSLERGVRQHCKLSLSSRFAFVLYWPSDKAELSPNLHTRKAGRGHHTLSASPEDRHTWHLRRVTSREQNLKIDLLSPVDVLAAPNAPCGWQGGSGTGSISVKRSFCSPDARKRWRKRVTSRTFLLRHFGHRGMSGRNWFCGNCMSWAVDFETIAWWEQGWPWRQFFAPGDKVFV